MIDYFINVGLSFLPYLGWSGMLIVLFYIPLLLLRFRQEYPNLEKIRTILRRTVLIVATSIFAIGLVVSTSSSANTFKLEQHNKVELNRKIESRNSNQPSGEIVDRTRKAMPEEERAARFEELKRY